MLSLLTLLGEPGRVPGAEPAGNARDVGAEADFSALFGAATGAYANPEHQSADAASGGMPLPALPAERQTAAGEPPTPVPTGPSALPANPMDAAAASTAATVRPDASGRTSAGDAGLNLAPGALPPAPAGEARATRTGAWTPMPAGAPSAGSGMGVPREASPPARARNANDLSQAVAAASTRPADRDPGAVDVSASKPAAMAVELPQPASAARSAAVESMSPLDVGQREAAAAGKGTVEGSPVLASRQAVLNPTSREGSVPFSESAARDDLIGNRAERFAAVAGNQSGAPSGASALASPTATASASATTAPVVPPGAGRASLPSANGEGARDGSRARGTLPATAATIESTRLAEPARVRQAADILREWQVRSAALEASAAEAAGTASRQTPGSVGGPTAAAPAQTASAAPATTAVGAEASPLSLADSQGAAQQLVQRMLQGQARNMSSLSFQLSPAELGQLQVNMRRQGDRMEIAFTATHAGARDLIEASLPALRSLLQEVGIQLADADVRHEAPGRDGSRGGHTGAGQGDAGSGDRQHDESRRPSTTASNADRLAAEQPDPDLTASRGFDAFA